MNQNEIWKDVVGFEGLYQISDLGNVKSLARIVPYENGHDRNINERILKQSINSTGYNQVCLHKNGKGIVVKTHLLVSYAFLNHEPCKLEKVVDHIDNDPSNNNLLNLQLITHRENCSKDKRTGTSKYTGVNFCKKWNKWVAKIYSNGKLYNLGAFKKEIDAHNAYQKTLAAITNQTK